MLRRYRKIKEDVLLFSGERLRVGELRSGMDEDNTLFCNNSAAISRRLFTLATVTTA